MRATAHIGQSFRKVLGISRRAAATDPYANDTLDQWSWEVEISRLTTLRFHKVE